MLCIECKEKLLRLPCKMENGTTKELWIHPVNPLKNCKYSQDGIKMEVSIYDSLLCQKFQELVEQEGIEEIKEQVVFSGNEQSEFKNHYLFHNMTTTELYKVAWIYREDPLIKEMADEELKHRGNF